MTGDVPQPESESPAPEAGSSPPVLALREIGKKDSRWTLTLHPDHLALAEPSAEHPPYVILRKDVMKTAMFAEGIRAFSIQTPRKATFQLTQEGAAKLAEWVGIPVLAGFYLKRRYSWVMPLAVIWIVVSLPMKGNPEKGISNLAFDPFALVLGTFLLISSAIAKYRPHPALFLVDSFWFLTMAGYLVVDIMYRGRNKAWLALVLVWGWLVVSGVRHFLRFRNTKISSL